MVRYAIRTLVVVSEELLGRDEARRRKFPRRSAAPRRAGEDQTAIVRLCEARQVPANYRTHQFGIGDRAASGFRLGRPERQPAVFQLGERPLHAQHDGVHLL
jgi:hypothetical protein